MEELIKKWKEYNIDRAEFEFTCGGDSMGDTELVFYDKDNNEVEVDFNSEIENEIYDNITFYDASDGHYQGEAGTVTVTLVEEEGEEPYFQFDKDAQSEYSESYTDRIQFEFSKEQYDYLEKHVEDIKDNYSIDAIVFLYKIDFFVSPEKELIEKSIMEIIKQMCDDHEYEYSGNGELEDSDYYDVNNIEFLGDNKINLDLNYRVTEYATSD
jgi:hypothetical protein